MPKIICHQCGRERVVIQGKRKNCRKCGTKLTDQQQPLVKLKAKAKAKKLADVITIEELAKMYPNQVGEIVKKTRAVMVAKEFGDMEPADIEETFPSEVAAIKLKATNEMGLKAEAVAAEHLAAVEALQADTKAAQETLAQADKTAKDALKEAVKKATADGTAAGRKAVLKLSIAKITKLKNPK